MRYFKGHPSRESSRERALREGHKKGPKRELKSDLNKALKGHSLRESEPCPVGAC